MQEVQRLRLRLASDTNSSSATAAMAEEDSYTKMKEKLGKETADKWRRVQEANRERDEARASAREATEASERLQHENVLLRGEMARLQKRLQRLRAKAARGRESGDVTGDGSLAVVAGVGDSSGPAAAAGQEEEEEEEKEEWFQLLLRQVNVDDEREEQEVYGESVEAGWQPPTKAEMAAASAASSQWSTVGFVASQPAVAEALAAAMMHTLPRGGWPSGAKSSDDHTLERALLRRMAEPGVEGGGRAGLRAALAEGDAVGKLVAAMWPAVEKLALVSDAL